MRHHPPRPRVTAGSDVVSGGRGQRSTVRPSGSRPDPRFEKRSTEPFHGGVLTGCEPRRETGTASRVDRGWFWLAPAEESRLRLMVSVHDVAHYMLKRRAMTAMKLQKLLYYAQACHL